MVFTALLLFRLHLKTTFLEILILAAHLVGCFTQTLLIQHEKAKIKKLIRSKEIKRKTHHHHVASNMNTYGFKDEMKKQISDPDLTLTLSEI